MSAVTMNEIGASLLGGALIGAAALALWGACRQVAGISSIFGGLFYTPTVDNRWRHAFLLGLVAGGTVLAHWLPLGVVDSAHASPPALVIAGLLVGFGTRLGGGCTSGHGVCGVGRLAPRSIVATLVFVAAGAIAVAVTPHIVAGG